MRPYTGIIRIPHIPYRVSKTSGHFGQFGQFVKTLSKTAKITVQTFEKVWTLLDPSGQIKPGHKFENLIRADN